MGEPNKKRIESQSWKDPGRQYSLRRRFRQEIIVISNHFGVAPQVLWGINKDKNVVRVRRAFARELRNRGISLDVIGCALGRDHSSVANLLKRKKRCYNTP